MDAAPIRYVRTSDGMDIAYYVRGRGRSVVFMPFHWNHLEGRWNGPSWIRPLAGRNRIIAYDSRGQGFSTRNLDRDPSVADYRLDLEAVMEAASAERPVLVAYGGFGHVAISYALDHAERVEALVLICTCESFSSFPYREMLPPAHENWDLFLDFAAAGVPPESKQGALFFMRASTTKDDFIHLVQGFSGSNVGDLLGLLRMPVLVLHSLDQHWLGVEEGTRFAAKIPGARLVFLNGDVEPNYSEGARAIQAFLDELPGGSEDRMGGAGTRAELSPRQVEVLRLVSAGKTTREIAAELVLSERTVERHISDIYARIGVTNRAAAIAYALREQAPR